MYDMLIYHSCYSHSFEPDNFITNRLKILKMKKYFKKSIYLLITFLSFLLMGTTCINTPDEFELFSEGTYMTINPSDPEFIKLVTLEGDIIKVFGERDNQGFPNVIRQINFEHKNGEKYFLSFGTNGKMVSAIADNGTVFQYEWISNSKIAVNIIASDGINQVNTEIDLAGLNKEKSASVQRIASAVPRHQREECFELEFTPFEFNDATEPIILKSASNYGTTHNLLLTSCGAPTFAEISRVNLYDQSGSVLLKELYAKPIAKGQYSITVPSGSAPSLNPQNAAKKLASVLAMYCDAIGLTGGNEMLASSQFCAALSLGLAKTGVGITMAPKALIACEGIAKSMVIYCKYFGQTAGIGAPSILDKIVESEYLEDIKLTGNMRLHVVINALPNNITKAFTIAEGTQQTLKAEISENAKPNITSLVLSPSSPSADQDYTVSVSVFCMPVGTKVTMDMVGTDGWTENKTFTITNASQSSGSFSMTVPGAETGVKDIITVTVQPPSGSPIVRTASLIFGK